MHLIALQDFGDYKVGDRITDPAVVAEILAGEQQRFVVKVAAPTDED